MQNTDPNIEAAKYLSAIVSGNKAWIIKLASFKSFNKPCILFFDHRSLLSISELFKMSTLCVLPQKPATENQSFFKASAETERLRKPFWGLRSANHNQTQKSLTQTL